jgi:sugar lactone lactonase YvrE
LYIGDCARRRVWAIRLNPTAKVEPFAAGVKLREPDGLAMDAAGNLWIADGGSGAIYVVAPNSQLLRTLTR